MAYIEYNEFFIINLYECLLDRQPDTDGLIFWKDHFDDGVLSEKDLIESFVNSQEYKIKMKQKYLKPLSSWYVRTYTAVKELLETDEEQKSFGELEFFGLPSLSIEEFFEASEEMYIFASSYTNNETVQDLVDEYDILIN